MYGSDNAGHTIHNSNRQLEKCVKILAQKLNLKPHQCGIYKTIELCTAADIEGKKVL